MKIQMDDKLYVLESITMKGSRYKGECTFVAFGGNGHPFNNTRITFDADFSLLMQDEVKSLNRYIESLKKENEDLKKERPKHYEGYFRDAAAHGVETLQKAAVAMVSEKEYEISKIKEELETERLKNAGLKAKIDQFGKSTSDLKAKFIGEHDFEVERWDSDQETEYYEKVSVPWTLQKQIFKEMCEYVKNRNDEDIRP